MLSSQEYDQRSSALSLAEVFISSIFDKYKPEQYSNQTGLSGPFQTPQKIIMTPADQFVTSMLNIADWLVKTE